MKKEILILFVLLSMISCKNQLVNYMFQKQGIYDEKISIKKLNYGNKEIVFLPMHHIGTNNFYSDVMKKVDSLKKMGYYFYTEKVNMNSEKKDLMKFRKIIGIGLPNGSYEKIMDSIILEKKLKMKNEIAFQPDYSFWKLNSDNSNNVDATIHDLVSFYESKYGEVKLEDCDFASPNVTNSTKCGKKKNYKKEYDEVVLDYRNNLIVNNIVVEPKQKIALIYGAGHYEGVKKKLDSLSISNQ